MTDLAGETPLTFKQASEESPGQPHTQTLNRWRKDGIRGVRLESFLVGGRRFTTREALVRFFTAVTNVSQSRQVLNATGSSTRRERQIEGAVNRLGHELGDKTTVD